MNKLIASTMVAGSIVVGGLAVAAVGPVAAVGARTSAATEASPHRRHPMLRVVVTTAAEAMDLSPRELVAELQAGRSIAEVASNEGVDIQTVTDALIAKATTAIETAVANGKIDEDRAARVLDRLPEIVDRVVHFHKGDGPHRAVGPGTG